MSGPFGSSQWMYSSGPAFDNWGGTVLGVTRGTGGSIGGTYNLSNAGTVSYATTGGGMYVIGMHQNAQRWLGIANGTSIQGQTGQMYSDGGIFNWSTGSNVTYRFKGISFTYDANTYATAKPYAILDLTGDSGNDNQIRLYGGDETLLFTYNRAGNTTWNVYTCAFDGGLFSAWDLEPIGQANYPF
jgi:hypothetical protein